MQEKKSTHKTEVIKVESIRNHPNADRLEIIDIFGFSCCVGKGQFKKGDLVAYIQPDSVVPLPDSGFENAEQFLFLNKGEAIENFKLSRRRITTCKLRGIYSQGLIVPAPKGLNVGDDASDRLGITHYEPPENDIKNADIEKPPIDGIYPSYDIDRLERFEELVFKPCEEVVMTEKVHGCQGSFCYNNGEFHVRSASEWKRATKAIILKHVENNWLVKFKMRLKLLLGKKKYSKGLCMWWAVLEKNENLQKFLKENPEYSVYGEVYGNVQSLKYGKPSNLDLVVFDILNNRTGSYVDWDESQELAEKYGLVWTPLLYRGKYDKELILSLIEKDSVLAEKNGVKGQIMEGGVIKPVKERWVEKVGRAQLKVISNRYYGS